MVILSTNNLTKRFGRITAVDQLNLEIKAGSVFGLLGPNGSGKTTALAMILGVIIPTNGDFQWFGEKASHEHRKRIGAILEKPNFYPSLSAYKNLQLACKIKEVAITRIPEVIEQVGLTERQHDKFKTYSLGMKQRLAIASALLGHPEVMILDEPTNGLDPAGIADIRQLIIDIANTGKTIILASHLLDEVQKVCTDFAILQRGKLIYSGEVDVDFREGVLIEIASDDLMHLTDVIKLFDGYQSHKLLKDRIEVMCDPNTRVKDVNKFLVSVGIYADKLNILKKNLEQQFMDIVSSNE